MGSMMIFSSNLRSPFHSLDHDSSLLPSIGYLFRLLAGMVLQMCGTAAPGHKCEVMMAQETPPLWLHKLCSEKFFNACSIEHRGLDENKSEKDVFCINCCSSFCKGCIYGTGHDTHQFFQIRSYDSKNAVRVEDLDKIFLSDGIQSYTYEEIEVVFIEKRTPTSEQNLSGNCCRMCQCHITDGSLYCSLHCKMIFLSINGGLKECIKREGDENIDNAETIKELTDERGLMPASSLQPTESAGNLPNPHQRQPHHITYDMFAAEAQFLHLDSDNSDPLPAKRRKGGSESQGYYTHQNSSTPMAQSSTSINEYTSQFSASGPNLMSTRPMQQQQHEAIPLTMPTPGWNPPKSTPMAQSSSARNDQGQISTLPMQQQHRQIPLSVRISMPSAVQPENFSASSSGQPPLSTSIAYQSTTSIKEYNFQFSGSGPNLMSTRPMQQQQHEHVPWAMPTPGWKPPKSTPMAQSSLARNDRGQISNVPMQQQHRQIPFSTQISMPSIVQPENYTSSNSWQRPPFTLMAPQAQNYVSSSPQPPPFTPVYMPGRVQPENYASSSSWHAPPFTLMEPQAQNYASSSWQPPSWQPPLSTLMAPQAQKFSPSIQHNGQIPSNISSLPTMPTPPEHPIPGHPNPAHNRLGFPTHHRPQPRVGQMGNQVAGILEILRRFINEIFFAHCTCNNGTNLKRSYFCFKCLVSCCPDCVAELVHLGHQNQTLQVYAQQGGQVRVEHLNRFIDPARIMTYKHRGGYSVVVIKERGQGRGRGGPLCRNCGFNIRDQFFYCSLQCKVEYLSTHGGLEDCLRGRSFFRGGRVSSGEEMK
ncbi:uncharacterized protein A4U43_C04F35470 [Asparagus officinalis]|uniref:B box-type domain-containing protein n=1 Tax=Asparagus officinalis TaxID=4686 RepID=A0A5P1F5Y0_ASPOF|nr:uncharacterized protein LOC109839650 isoform X2 [Asparagus officinalis]XP_020263750.1 uncharacterized protein LOC109839650 isoform X2 [Asparagus officinalis]ONK73796.1 uncharacterized protein A4U43_C04F35470 [Asparagus officinalis]